MNEVHVKSNLCRIFHRQEDKKVLLFGCGCLVKCNDGSLKIATSREVRNLMGGEVFAKFDATRDQENKLQINTEEQEENPGSENMEIAYFSIDMNAFEPLPVGLCEANNLVAIDDIACRVAVLENLEQFGDTTDFKFYSVVKDQGKCILKIESGRNERVLERKADFQQKHLKVLGSPIVSFQEDCKFLGIVDFLQVERDFLLRLVYRGTPRSFSDESKQVPKNTVRLQETNVGQDLDLGRDKLSTAEPLSKLWDINIDFRDRFSKVLDYKYKHSKYWPHLAEKFGVDKSKYETFSTSDITSPAESMFEYLETTQPDFNVTEFCQSLKNADGHEVLRIVKNSVEAGDLKDEHLVSDICDITPNVWDEIVLKLDRDDKLWQNIARDRGIHQKKYLAFHSNRTDNPARIFFDVLRTQGPEQRVQNLKEKSTELKLKKIPWILKTFKIPDNLLLTDLSKHPDAKGAIEYFLNQNLKEDYLWNLASLYQKEDLMQDLEIENVFREQEEVHSPTCQVFEYVLTRMPTKFTIQDLIIELGKINRKDCYSIIQPYLKGGMDDIEKITQGLEKLQVTAPSNGGRQPSIGDERSSVDASDQQENQYLFANPN